MTARRRIALFAIVATVVVLAVVAAVFVRRSPRFLSENSQTYEEVSRAFYHGYAALQVGLLTMRRRSSRRRQTSCRVSRRPGQIWGSPNFVSVTHPAAQAMAAQLAPSNSDIAFLQGQLETGRGRPDEAIARFKHAVDLNRTGLRVRGTRTRSGN